MNERWILLLAMTLVTLMMYSSCRKDDDKKKDDPLLPLTVKDIDGNTYVVVTVGGQEWMAEDLRATRYRDGGAIPHVHDRMLWRDLTSPAYCWYDNDSVDPYTGYGMLYNWFAVATDKLCPTGWNVPSDEDWQELESHLGMAAAVLGNRGWRGQDEGGQLKEQGTIHWQHPNTAATNATLFTALPGGYRSSTGMYYGLGVEGSWWSRTAAATASNAWYRRLAFDSGGIGRFDLNQKSGFAVRCVRQ
jgi:uncharacterized protein (TIGR02145 family)